MQPISPLNKLPLSIIKRNIWSDTDTLDALAHGCNARGVMGAGFAVQIREKYKDLMYLDYRTACRTARIGPGDILFHESDDANLPDLYNLITQEGFHGARINYVQAAFEAMFRHIIEGLETPRDFTLGMPAIGCGLGGLKLPDVIHALESAWKKIVPCHLTTFINLRMYMAQKR